MVSDTTQKNGIGDEKLTQIETNGSKREKDSVKICVLVGINVFKVCLKATLLLHWGCSLIYVEVPYAINFKYRAAINA